MSGRRRYRNHNHNSRRGFGHDNDHGYPYNGAAAGAVAANHHHNDYVGYSDSDHDDHYHPYHMHGHHRPGAAAAAAAAPAPAPAPVAAPMPGVGPPPRNLPPGYTPTVYLDDDDLDADARLAMLLQAQESFGVNANLTLIQDMMVANLLDDQEANDHKLAQELAQVYDTLHGDVPTDEEVVFVREILRREPKLATAGEGGLPLMFPAKPGQCSVCSDEIWVGGRATLPPQVDVGEAAVLFPECEHEYCATCLRDWVKSTVNDRQLQFPTKCALPDCTSVLTADHLRDLAPDFVLDGKTHDKYLERYLESEGKAIYCPQRGCGAYVVVDNPNAGPAAAAAAGNAPVGLHVQCHQCESIMCFRCKALAHHPLSCAEFMALPDEERNPDDVAVLQIGRANLWKRCPGCQTLVERKDGCNFIKCACGEGFCYRCGAKYVHLNRTAANQHGQPGCQCNLFDVPADLAQELARNQAPVQVVAGHAAAYAGAIRAEYRHNPNDRTADLEELLANYAWPRYRTGRRVMAHGHDEVWTAPELRAAGMRVPPWLGNYLNNLQCHYCHDHFGTWAHLCNHLFTTRAHEVYMCCNRTFTNERGVLQHIREKHGGDPGALEPYL